MTSTCIADDEFGLAKLKLVAVRQGELFQRVMKGMLDPDWVADELQRIIYGKLGDVAEQIVDWGEFYDDVFGIKTDFSTLLVPGKKAGFDRLVVLAQGMTTQRLYDKCAKLFYCRGSKIPILQSERTAQNGPYAVWVCDRVEADGEFKNLSANILKQMGVPGVTLEERLLYELKYFEETSRHLDTANITLCTGSRYSDGYVPGAGWIQGVSLFEIYGYNPDNSFPYLRSRAVVS